MFRKPPALSTESQDSPPSAWYQLNVPVAFCPRKMSASMCKVYLSGWWSVSACVRARLQDTSVDRGLTKPCLKYVVLCMAIMLYCYVPGTLTLFCAREHFL